MEKGVRNMGKGVRNMGKGVRNIRNTLRNIMIRRLICFLIQIVWLRRCPILALGSVLALAFPEKKTSAAATQEHRWQL
jgi:t-SNARE complex subunit (syntaxin)